MPDALSATALLQLLHQAGTVLLRREPDDDQPSEKHSDWLLYHSPQEMIVATRIDEVQAAIRRVEHTANGGADLCGYIAYEAAPAIDPAMRTCCDSDLPDSAGTPLVWFGVYDRCEELHGLPDLPGTDCHLGRWNASKSRDEYRHNFQRIKQYIASGDTYQINYTLSLDAEFSGSSYALFHELYRRQPSSYAAYLHTGKNVICSVSPELFYRQQGQRIVTRPMKGTRPTSDNPEHDNANREELVTSEKERAENTMIVDMIRNDLGRIATVGTVKTPSLFDIEKYPTVWQMTSTVECRTKSGTADVIDAMFPCASITGAPKIRSMEIIRELEADPRGVYTGVIGRVSRDESRLSVAIRTACVDTTEHRVRYGCGGGIVWDSQEADEYAECMTKAKIVTDVRHEFSLLETILWTGRRLLLLSHHLDRLVRTARFFGYPIDRPTLELRLQSLASELDSLRHRVRLLLSPTGDVSIEKTPITESPGLFRRRKVWTLGLAGWPIDSVNPFVSHKTTRRDLYERAKAEQPDCDDVLLYNQRGEITETTIANVVLRIGGHLYTPSCDSGLLPGTFRRYLLDKRIVQEKRLTLDDLQCADELLLVNSVRGFIPAILCDSTKPVFFGGEKTVPC